MHPLRSFGANSWNGPGGSTVVNIRVAEPSEAGEMARAISEAWASHEWLKVPAASAESLIGKTPERFVVGAWWDYRPVGAISIEIVSAVARVTHLVVVPDHRRRGIAGRLLAAAEKEAQARGCARIDLVSIEELGIAPLFVNAGYRALGREMVYQSRLARRPFCKLRFHKSIKPAQAQGGSG